MKKIISMLLALLLLMSGTIAFAESGARALTLTGNVVEGETLTVKAPYGGTVQDFTARVGDLVQPGEALFKLSTTKIYAPTDGKVSGLFAQPGDAAAYVQDRYGALLYIEPVSRFVIDTTVAKAYNKNENRIVHIGEKVYLVSTGSKSRKGTGFVTAVNGKNFSVEVTGGNLRFDENANIYRSSNHKSKTRIGRGKTKRIAAVAVTGEGSVLKLHVASGDNVERGQLLAETVTGTLPQFCVPTDVVMAPERGVIASIEVQSGGAVNIDQTLAILHPTAGYQVAADINEVDLSRVKVGDAVNLEFIGFADQAYLPGTITSISALSSTDKGDAEYKVYIDFEANASVRQGMTVTVHLT